MSKKVPKHPLEKFKFKNMISKKVFYVENGKSKYFDNEFVEKDNEKSPNS